MEKAGNEELPHIPFGSGICGHVAQTKEAVILKDAYQVRRSRGRRRRRNKWLVGWLRGGGRGRGANNVEQTAGLVATSTTAAGEDEVPPPHPHLTMREEERVSDVLECSMHYLVLYVYTVHTEAYSVFFHGRVVA